MRADEAIGLANEASLLANEASQLEDEASPLLSEAGPLLSEAGPLLNEAPSVCRFSCCPFLIMFSFLRKEMYIKMLFFQDRHSEILDYPLK